MNSSRQPALFDLGPEPEKWELEAERDFLAALVVFNRPLDPVFHYLVPEEFREMIAAGQRVRVPFGRGDQLITGYCVGLTTQLETTRRLKSIREILDREPLISAGMLELTRWISERYLCSWGQVLESVIPAGVKKQSGTREILTLALAENISLTSLRLSGKQKVVVEVLQKSAAPLTIDVLTKLAGCGTSPIDTLRRKGVIVPIRVRSQVAEADALQVVPQTDLKLNLEQNRCLKEILAALRQQIHQAFLLHGVTGSGKTEVYIQAIREVVSYGRQAIVLVPEISLTPQTIRRFRARFESVAVLHSHLSDADRHWHWQEISAGRVQVVVGARSAIFAPTPHLGLIIIDEEHEATFKQHSTPRYHAVEVARERARRESIPLIIGSATPTLESLLRAQSGEDKLLRMAERVERRPLPPVSIVDTRNDPLIGKGHSIGRALGNAIQNALRDKGQVILFLNLRGYAPVHWCKKCGGVRCPDCDITLTWHKDKGQLLCHSCEYACDVTQFCPTCGAPGMKFLGTGTQRLEAEVKTKFPDARLVRMDSDSMRAPGSHDTALEAFREGKTQILLGTQMIAKGLDFPNVTLVGVIDADTLLHQPELRAAERTFQLISQVAGRTGRGDRDGRVLVQTMAPDEPVIRLAAKHDYDSFARRELQQRQEMHAPPYSVMARLILRSLNEETVQLESRRIAAFLKEQIQLHQFEVRVLGPAPAPITKLRKFYRFHMQLTAKTHLQLQEVWKQCASRLQLHTDVELVIDVDPMDLR